MEAYPAINRWAISGRPLRGLESEKNQTLAGAEAAIQSPVDTMFIETNNSSQTKKARSSFTLSGLVFNNPGGFLLSHAVARAVPSAPRGLTSVFGMGTGVTLSTQPPENFSKNGL